MPDSKTFSVNNGIHHFSVFPHIVAQTLPTISEHDAIKTIPDDKMDYMNRLNGTAENSLLTVHLGLRGIGQLIAEAAGVERT